jgi:membrane protease subunit (stomatin/prohibitin family)
MSKNVQEYLDKVYEDERKPIKKIEMEKVETQEEGVGRNIVNTAVGMGSTALGAAGSAALGVGPVPGMIAGAVAGQAALQAINKRKQDQAAKAQAQHGASNTDEKYAGLAKQRAETVH